MTDTAAEKQNPLVSIIVITYNSAKYVLETLESAKAQTYQNIELIVSDDCSTDNTVEICRKWIERNGVRFMRTEIITVPFNTGIPANCNRGVKAAKGIWGKFIAGDDALYPDYLENCINYLMIPENNKINFLYTNIQRYKDNFMEKNLIAGSNPTIFKINAKEISAAKQFEILLRFNPILAVSFIFKRDALCDIALLNERYTLFEDWPLWLKITGSGHKIHYLDTIGVKHRVHHESVQIMKKRKEQVFTDFQLVKSKMILKEYLQFYPFFERILIWYINSMILLFNKMGLNHSRIYAKLFNKLIYLPNLIIISINNKYK